MILPRLVPRGEFKHVLQKMGENWAKNCPKEKKEERYHPLIFISKLSPNQHHIFFLMRQAGQRLGKENLNRSGSSFLPLPFSLGGGGGSPGVANLIKPSSSFHLTMWKINFTCRRWRFQDFNHDTRRESERETSITCTSEYYTFFSYTKYVVSHLTFTYSWVCCIQ